MSHYNGILQKSEKEPVVPKQKLKWDENKLKETERRQKEQVFMKIDEPNTPYIHYNPTTDQVINWQDVPESVREAAMEEPEEFSLGDDKTITNKVTTKDNDEWKEVDRTEEEKKQDLAEKRHLEFERKRAQHYKHMV